jgi:hypothetical protein
VRYAEDEGIIASGLVDADRERERERVFGGGLDGELDWVIASIVGSTAGEEIGALWSQK